MKRLICVVIALVIFVSASGCGKQEASIAKPVNFYYKTNPEKYQSAAITPEVRESKDFENDLAGLLQLYLTGPLSEDFTNPFPEGLEIISVKVNNSNVQLQLNANLALLSDTRMSIACACLTLTTLELAQRNRIVITALDESGNILYTASMTKDQILLNDTN